MIQYQDERAEGSALRDKEEAMVEEKKPKGTWGGYRKGAGRKSTLPEGEVARVRSVRVIDKEWLAIKKLIAEMRK